MSTSRNIKLLFFGDVIGRPGRQVIKTFLTRNPEIADLIVANVENAAHGFGTSEANLEELRSVGVTVFTGGNHTFDRKEIFEFIDKDNNVVRPANYPEGTPGKGYCLVSIADGIKVAVVNIMGRVFMEPLRSPFLVADEIIEQVKKETNIILVDFHAEATAEKVAMGWYLDGRVSAVVGTHTHVQTADERILPGGTAYLTDAGCCGPRDGVIGMDKESVFKRMVKQLPARFDVAAGPAIMCGVLYNIDSVTGKALSVQRMQFIEGLDDTPDNQRVASAVVND
jgi:2',3'-cyclic-nucleotide 2'-phosphodiesterase